MKKKLLPRAYSALLICLGFALLVMVNVCASLLSGRSGLRLDMTSNQLYKLSGQTLEILDHLQEPVCLKVFSAQADFLPLVEEVLKEYQWNGGGKVEVEYIDPYTQPTLVDDYLQRGLTVELGSIVVESAHRAKALKLEEMFEMSSGGSSVEGLKCEQQLTSAIHYTTSGENLHVAFTAGHNENISDGFVEMLAQNNYSVSYEATAMVDIGPDVDLLVIAAPSSDFGAEEISKLDQFLARGGRMLVFVEPSSTDLTNLKGFLEEWGIGLTDIVVAEALQYTDSNPLSIVPIYSAHEINQYFKNNQIYPVMPSTRALEQKYVSQGAVRTQKLLYSTDRSYDAQEEDGAKGPFVLAMTAQKELENGKARLVVFGGSGIYADSLLQTEAYGNAKLLSQTINWCTEVESTIHIPTKSLGEAPISLTTGRAILLSALFVLVLPVGTLIYGFGVYRRRRRS